MRIIGGIAAGRILKVPRGLEVRPTADLVKQALFNSLGPRVGGAQVLELFAGTGALSLECLSRGAANAFCVEKSRRQAEFIRRNLAETRLPPAHLEVRVLDAFAAIGQLRAAGQSFDLVLADPPYGEKNVGRRSASSAQRLLDDPDLPSLIAGGGLLVLGHARRDTVTVPEGWREAKTLRHGDSVMRLLRPAGASE